MNKNEMLALLDALKREAEYALSRSDLTLTSAERKNLERKYRLVLNYYAALLDKNAITNNDEREMIKLYKDLKQVNQGNTSSLNTDIVKRETNDKIKVQKVRKS